MQRLAVSCNLRMFHVKHKTIYDTIFSAKKNSESYDGINQILDTNDGIIYTDYRNYSKPQKTNDGQQDKRTRIAKNNFGAGSEKAKWSNTTFGRGKQKNG